MGLRSAIKDELRSSWLSMLGALLCMGAYKRLKKRVDPSEYGAAPLLGVKGLVFILHGASTAESVASGIRAAAHAAESDITEHIRRGVEEMRSAEGYSDEQESGA
jgi:glycerol-3-phosphate acyltransferase PlsX